MKTLLGFRFLLCTNFFVSPFYASIFIFIWRLSKWSLFSNEQCAFLRMPQQNGSNVKLVSKHTWLDIFIKTAMNLLPFHISSIFWLSTSGWHSRKWEGTHQPSIVSPRKELLTNWTVRQVKEQTQYPLWWGYWHLYGLTPSASICQSQKPKDLFWYLRWNCFSGLLGFILSILKVSVQSLSILDKFTL